MSDGTGLTGLILAVFRLNGSLLAAGDALVADLGLTSARWQVLGAVALAEAPMPVAGVARAMGLSRQNVQRIADDLVGKGLLTYAANPLHRRAKLVLLTGEGRRIYEAAALRQRPWAQALSRDIAAADLAMATDLLRQLSERLDAEARTEHNGETMPC